MLGRMTNPEEIPAPPPILAQIHAKGIDLQPTTGPNGEPVVVLNLRNEVFAASILVGRQAAEQIAEQLLKGTAPRLAVASPADIAALGRGAHNGRRN